MSDYTHKFKYAKFQYYVTDPDWENIPKDWLRPYKFFVIGGSSRVIEVNSINEAALTSEFYEARAHKNIQLSISQSKNSVAVTAELMEIAFKKLAFKFDLIVSAFSGKRHIASLQLLCDATLRQNPIPIGNNALALDVYIPPDADILHVTHNAKNEYVFDKF